MDVAAVVDEGTKPMASKTIRWLLSLPRPYKRSLQVAVDVILLVGSFVLAMGLRWDSFFFLDDPRPWIAIGATIPPTLYIFITTGFYRALIRYISSRAILTMGRGIVISAIFLFAVSQLFSLGVPRSVPGIYAMLALISIGGTRFMLRELLNNELSRGRRPVLIYGAGTAGRQLVDALRRGHEHVPVALVDDRRALIGAEVAGLRVHPPSQLVVLVQNLGIELALLAMPNASRSRRREIIDKLVAAGAQVRTVPGMSDIISGRSSIADVREVPLEDLLGRDPVAPVPELMSANIAGKSVMVTGAGGSIGSELCRQILDLNPRKLVLFEISEPALYAIDLELSRLAAKMMDPPEIVPLLGSVQAPLRIRQALAQFGVDTIFHAAAYKHVPLVEHNVVEGIRNNVFGTRTLLAAAIEADVQSFTLISTDKAVRPTNVMGASKRVAEMICQVEALRPHQTKISIVRFGNVLGSSGSVIPLFRQQIRSGGPITVTDPEITRYFMSISEAAQLVIQSSAMAHGGDVFLLDMGDPVKILDLAIRMARLSGLKPYLEDQPGEGGDIAIRFTGMRPGEKLYEELLIDADSRPTAHPRIQTARESCPEPDTLEWALDSLLQASLDQDLVRLRDLLASIVTGYVGASAPIDAGGDHGVRCA